VAQMRFGIEDSSEEQEGGYPGKLVIDVEHKPKPASVPTRLL